MSTADIAKANTAIRLGNVEAIAESIRRLDGPAIGKLIELLCQDNMGTKLVHALEAEIQDQTYRSEV